MKCDGCDDFGQDWEELCRDQICDFQNYVSVDRDVATKNKEDENEDMVQSLAETYEALEKVMAFFYAHSVTYKDRERILGIEHSYFQLRKNCAMKQKQCTIFVKKVVFWIFRLFSPVPSKTKNRDFTVFDN
jgi:hypothetical protein